MIVNENIAKEMYRTLITNGVRQNTTKETDFNDVVYTVNFINCLPQKQQVVDAIQGWQVDDYKLAPAIQDLILPMSVRQEVSDTRSPQYKSKNYYSMSRCDIKGCVLDPDVFNNLMASIYDQLNHKAGVDGVVVSTRVVTSYEAVSHRLVNECYLSEDCNAGIFWDDNGNIRSGGPKDMRKAVADVPGGFVPIASVFDGVAEYKRTATAQNMFIIWWRASIKKLKGQA